MIIFEKFNQEFFKNELPKPNRFVVKTLKSFLGKFTVKNSSKNPIVSIVLNDRYDLDEIEMCNTLLHEMVHYFIWYKQLSDTSSHGSVFISYCQSIYLCSDKKYCPHRKFYCSNISI